MIPSTWDEATPSDLKRTKRVRKPHDSANTDRLPPHSIECEMGVLGCILLSPRETMPECIEKLRANGEEFYDLKHLTIYGVLLDMYDTNKQIDVITVQQILKDRDMLEQCGGITYLASLPDSVPSAANLSYYLDFVAEKYLLRRTLQISTEVVEIIYESRSTVETILDEVESNFIKLRENRSIIETPTIKQLIDGNIQTIDDYNNRQGTVSGIATGFTDLDKLTFGFQNSEMIVIAARPSIGKTSLLLNITDNIIVEQKLPVGIFSLEMSAPALSMRMLCSRARVNMRNVREGFMADRDYPKLTGAAGKIANAPVYIDDSPNLTIIQLRAKARRMVDRYKVKLIGIDYLQLLRGSLKRPESRQQEVSEIARAIKAMAKELGIPIVVLCQLNRALEREGARKPRLSDLRESGEIENTADLICFLYVPLSEKDEEDREEYFDYLPVNLLIGKQRNGPTGEVPLTFLKPYTRFESAAKVSEEDLPYTTSAG